MRPDRERQIHDYLDGRLSAAEREEFEAAMERDASLSMRVADFRDIGTALRDGGDELSDAFYAKARERFKASRRPRLARLWSWEAASLLAAATLIFALFMPTIFDEGGPDRAAGSPSAFDESEPVAAAEKPRQRGGAQAEPPVPAERATATGERPPAQGDLAEVAGKVAGVASDADAVRSEKSQELKAAPSAPAAEGMGAPTPSGARESAPPEARASTRKRAMPAVVRLTRAPPAAIGLPTIQEWSRMANEPGFEALGALERPSDESRLLWVGGPIDCDRLTASVDADGWRVELHPGQDIACAMVIPADGLPVRTVAGTAR